jgi:pyruvate kinase
VEVEKEEVVYNRNLVPQKHSPTFLSDALCYNAAQMTKEVEANALIATTRSGFTAFMVSSFRPHCPIYVFTDRNELVNQLSLSWGVNRTFYFPNMDTIDEMIKGTHLILKGRKLIATGDVVVNTGSMPILEELPTNMLKVSTVK